MINQSEDMAAVFKKMSKLNQVKNYYHPTSCSFQCRWAVTTLKKTFICQKNDLEQVNDLWNW
jgi:hypothetical protein